MIYDYLFLGNGLATSWTLFFFSKKLKENKESKKNKEKFISNNLSCLQISEARLFPEASLSSLGLCAIYGAKENRGVGDFIVKGYKKLEEVLTKEKKIQGIKKVPLLALCPQTKEDKVDNFMRRFNEEGELNYPLKDFFSSHKKTYHLPKSSYLHEEECYDYDPKKLLDSLDGLILENFQEIRDTSKGIPFEKREDAITRVEDQGDHYLLSLKWGGEVRARHLFFGPGSYGTYNPHLWPKDFLKQFKVNSGHYLVWDKKLFPPKISREGQWFCYDKTCFYQGEDKIFMGAETNKESILLPNRSKLEKIYKDFADLFGDDYPLPPLEEAEVVSQQRLMGPKRRPFCGEVYPENKDHKFFAFLGLHKNGLCYSLHFSYDLAEKILGF